MFLLESGVGAYNRECTDIDIPRVYDPLVLCPTMALDQTYYTQEL